ncbi:MAG: Gfo/Idh/MocA family oxidoreductase [Chloroflexi bacterium]|nr:Gfo/Idh/MocA family oxidoreductase [Chloroflexota bacterium]
MNSKIKVGVIGCGVISKTYFTVLQTFEILEVAACADLLLERAQARAAEFNIPKACTVEELLADPHIQIVLNLTIPAAHAAVALAALVAGKSVYNEKPLTITREEGRRILELAQARNLLVGCAPDTFLGGGLQTCRKVLDDGLIGEPIGAFAAMISHGHEGWHPAPDFYYQPGGGPMFDMGPYYLTALAVLIGPVRRVTGMARITFPERMITSQPLSGAKIQVRVPTHVTGLLEFANGAIGNITTTFDVWAGELPRIEIYGTEGTLSVPDPNGFRGPIRVWRPDTKEWRDIPLSHGHIENSRGIGVADMAYALRSGRPHRANGDLAYHVLDIMHAIHDAAREGRQVDLQSTVTRPAPLPSDLPENILDD